MEILLFEIYFYYIHGTFYEHYKVSRVKNRDYQLSIELRRLLKRNCMLKWSWDLTEVMYISEDESPRIVVLETNGERLKRGKTVDGLKYLKIFNDKAIRLYVKNR